MEKPTLNLTLLRDEIEYLTMKQNFFEGQTELWSKKVIKKDLKNQEIFEQNLMEEQELTVKLLKGEQTKIKLLKVLEDLRGQQEIEEPKDQCKNVDDLAYPSKQKFEMKFIYAGITARKKLHVIVLSEICKTCKKGFPNQIALKIHVIRFHFSKLHCEVSNCSSNFNSKRVYKQHLKSMHKKDDQGLIKKMVKKVIKLKPDFEQLKYI